MNRKLLGLLLLGFVLCGLSGCKHDDDVSAVSGSSFSEIGEVRVFDEDRRVAAGQSMRLPKLNKLDGVAAGAHTVAPPRKYVMIGELDMND